VTLTHDIEMMQYEVTQAAWTALGIPNPSRTGADAGDYDLDDPRAPVGNVTYSEAHAFANLLSDAHVPPLPHCYALNDCSSTLGNGLMCSSITATVANIYECQGYRLPTEAEWEYACRAGTTTALYTGDVTVGARPTDCIYDPALDRAGWYCFNSGFKTHVVGGKEPNLFGLFDMLGNANEWVEDPFNGLGYGPGPDVDPGSGLAPSVTRVLRGGVVTAYSTICRCAERFDVGDVESNASGTGFRLVRTLARARGAD
jgi:formylglycine-generating enzyme required for sulfatase activity